MPLSLQSCLEPILTAGIPKNAPSLKALDQLPMKHAALDINLA